MLYFDNSLVVSSFLLSLCLDEEFWEILVLVTLSKWAEEPYVKKCSLPLLPESPFRYVRPCFVPDFAWLPRHSPVKDVRDGSTSTSLLVWSSSLAIVSFTSSCLWSKNHLSDIAWHDPPCNLCCKGTFGVGT